MNNNHKDLSDIESVDIADKTYEANNFPSHWQRIAECNDNKIVDTLYKNNIQADIIDGYLVANVNESQKEDILQQLF